jgi:hypothetical protein
MCVDFREMPILIVSVRLPGSSELGLRAVVSVCLQSGCQACPRPMYIPKQRTCVYSLHAAGSGRGRFTSACSLQASRAQAGAARFAELWDQLNSDRNVVQRTCFPHRVARQMVQAEVSLH